MPLLIKVTGATHHNDIFINASKIEFFKRIKPPKGDYTEISFGALDTSVCVSELPEEINNLIREAVAAFGFNESPIPSPTSMWHIPMPSAELPSSEEDMPLPDEGCVCGIRPHF